MRMLISGKTDGWQQEFSGLLSVKHIFKSTVNVEHEEEQSTHRKRGKHNTWRASPQQGGIRAWLTPSYTAPAILENIVQGETTAVTVVQQQAWAGLSHNLGMKALACWCPWKVSSHMCSGTH